MEDTSDQLDERLDRVEIKLAYLEDFLDRLQLAVLEQGRQMDKLNQEHRVLKDKILFLTKELEEIPNRKPPHY
ncbi:SlyX family protein [Gracilinema caldarium]|uniref:SlyX family protein n=1 Tax=Gracilinema caldarium TaxID=215591 RepID=UPI0026E9E6C0|nr:SlyX family protein [Gracilinema caldarium]